MSVIGFDPTQAVSPLKPLAIVGHTDMCDMPTHLGITWLFVKVGHRVTFNSGGLCSVGTITCIGRRAYNDEVCVQVTYASIHGKDRHNEWFRLADCEGINGKLRQRV